MRTCRRQTRVNWRPCTMLHQDLLDTPGLRLRSCAANALRLDVIPGSWLGPLPALLQFANVRRRLLLRPIDAPHHRLVRRRHADLLLAHRLHVIQSLKYCQDRRLPELRLGFRMLSGTGSLPGRLIPENLVIVKNVPRSECLRA